MDQNGISATLLRSHGLRATPQRIALMKMLAKARKPLSIPELSELSPIDAMDNATFYRGLESLSETGLVRKVDLRHGHTDYELVKDEKHHHHLVCKKCGKIEDISWCPDPGLKQRILKGTSFSTVSDHAIEFFGICKSCA